jgi:phenylalanine-4-hydroxylase
MMKQQTNYKAKTPDINGMIPYTAEEDSVWRDLYERQIKIIENRACDEYIKGLEILNLPKDRVPQCVEVSNVLTQTTGWAVTPVAALIPFNEFFTLLANRKFPAASFIRTREELDYLKEPDIFHEIFGHCPLLTNQVYADFVQKYGELGLAANQKERVLLARLFWFTIEFGLINTQKGLRVYGAGILSSKEETIYALESVIPQRKSFLALDALRTPYRYDIKQTIYFVINSYQDIFDLISTDIMDLVRESQILGEFPPEPPMHGC